MRIAAWLILIAILGVPLVVGVWLLFPVVAGIAAAVLLSGRGPSWMRRYLSPILYLLLLGFMIWLYFLPFRNPPSVSVAASPVAGLLTGTPVNKATVDNNRLVELHRTLSKELAVVRFKIQKVASAIDTLRSAESVFVGLSVKGKPDQGNLGPALEDVRAALSSAKIDGTASNLLDPWP